MLIGLCGAAGSGKSTAAEILRDELPGLTFIAPLAAPLKLMFDVAFPTLRGAYENRALKEKSFTVLGGKSPRFVLQTLGTEWGRELISPDIWILSLESRLAGEESDNLLIPDVRFENEARWVRRQGGELWLILRQGEALGPDNAAHSSESGVPADLVSRAIVNPGNSIPAFRSLLLDMASEYRGAA